MSRPSTNIASARPGQGSAADPARWPGLASVPRTPVRAAVARRVFARTVRGLDLRVELPGGRTVASAGGPGAPVLRILREEEFFARVGADGMIGFGEAYMVGAWDADDLTGVLAAFATRMARIVPPAFQWLRRWYEHRQPAADGGTPDGARSNAHRHYDLSNELFATFLDPSMTYSSALFAPGDDLERAQLRKIDVILDAAGVDGPGCRLLEIGTGWGSLAIRAARERGAEVTTVTLSSEQRELAVRRAAEAGVGDRVNVLLRDYREVAGRYDAVVSVEMIEAVGYHYWPSYFAALDRLLAPGGRIGLQAITIADDRMRATRDSYTWIHKYVFPGGKVPSAEAIADITRRTTSLRVASRLEFGHDYAETLRLWRERFEERLDDVRALGFDGTFTRMWRFYLAYCEAGFRVGYLGVSQFTLARE